MKGPKPAPGRRVAPAKRTGKPPPIRTQKPARLPGGHTLDPGTRSVMETHLGRSFHDVQVHTGPDAAQSARAINARAFTVGSHIVFDAGQYRPWSADGRRLLAHELAHVAQPVEPGRILSEPGDAGEREAEQAASAVASGKTATVGHATGAAIRRQEHPNVMPGKLKLGSDIPSSTSLIENASPLLAAALGSATLNNFDTAKSELKSQHIRDIESVARNVKFLSAKYSLSTLEVTGFADTVGTEANNLGLGQQRADVVKEALIERGVPEAMITAKSRGEGGPQAIKTKDEVPSAANRRVEIQFRPGRSLPGLLGGQLKPPEPFQPGDKTRPPIDFTTPPDIDVCRPPFVCPPKPPFDFETVEPPPIKRQSLSDVISEKIIDPVVDTVMKGTSKKTRDFVKEKARSAVESGIAKGARTAAEASGVTDSAALDAIEKAAEAAIKEKGERQK